MKAALQQRFHLDDSRVVQQAQLKRWSTEVFNRTFAATAALNSLTLGVAGVALFINLLTLGQSVCASWRRYSPGVRRTQLVWLSLARHCCSAALTVLLALPLGLLLAWCLVAVVNVQAFGWRLPLCSRPVAATGPAGPAHQPVGQRPATLATGPASAARIVEAVCR